MSLILEAIRKMFAPKRREVDRQIEQVTEQAREVKRRLSAIADNSRDPFSDLVRTMRQEAVRRNRPNGNGNGTGNNV